MRWLTEEEQAAWRGLLRTHARLTNTLNRQLATTGLSLQDYGVLVALDESQGGRLRPYEIGDELGLEKTRLSHQLGRLEQRGLVGRERCPTDQRGSFVTLTAAGRKTLKAAAPAHVAAVRAEFVDRLTPAQLRAMADIAAAVVPEEEAAAYRGRPGAGRGG